MKRILIHIATWIVAFWVTIFMCTSCGLEFFMRDDTFTVMEEKKYGATDSLSLYTLRYKNDKIFGIEPPTSDLYVIMNRNAFDVGDKVKLVKVED